MKIDSLRTYAQVIQYLESNNRPKQLLLGNGFSMAYDNGIFSYNALSTFIERTNNDLLQKLFSIINTKNFELIMQQLDSFIEIAKIFSTDEDLIRKITEANQTLKDNLINAVKGLHPAHVYAVSEEKSKSCFAFLNSYLCNNERIFSTNYDLLLYWVLMRNDPSFAVDGFGRDHENPDETIAGDIARFSELRWGKHKASQTIFYLHGALPLFDTGVDIVKEEYDSQHHLLQKINDRMENKQYPIFVTAGTANEKLNHIMHNKYLTFCYEQLSCIQGSLITFGFNFGDYDTHIIEAFNKAAHNGNKGFDILRSIYIGVYSDSDFDHILRISKNFKCKVNMYNARSLKIW